MNKTIYHQSTNDKHNYDNRRSYNNLPLRQGECLVPIRVDLEMVTHFNMCNDNLETWHIGPNKILVAFAPVAIEKREAAIMNFNRDIYDHLTSSHTDDILSLDQILEDVVSEDSKCFEPASLADLEENAILRMIIRDLLEQVRKINPKYGRILEFIYNDYSNEQILEKLNLDNSQGIAEIKAAQNLAKELYERY